MNSHKKLGVTFWVTVMVIALLAGLGTVRGSRTLGSARVKILPEAMYSKHSFLSVIPMGARGRR